jgi:hypothetical protein
MTRPDRRVVLAPFFAPLFGIALGVGMNAADSERHRQVFQATAGNKALPEFAINITVQLSPDRYVNGASPEDRMGRDYPSELEETWANPESLPVLKGMVVLKGIQGVSIDNVRLAPKKFTSDGEEGPGKEEIIAINPSENLAFCTVEALVDSVALTGIFLRLPVGKKCRVTDNDFLGPIG